MERASYDQSIINLNNEEKIYTFGINCRELRLHAGICQWMGGRTREATRSNHYPFHQHLMLITQINHYAHKRPSMTSLHLQHATSQTK